MEIIVDLIKGEGLAKGKTLPTVFGLGSDAYATIKAASENTLSQLEEWKEVIVSTDFPKGT